MFVLAHKREKTYKAWVLGLVAVYALITCAVPFLHKDDCTATHGVPKTPLQSNGPCPACMLLANSHSAPVHCDSLPGLTQSKILPAPAGNTVVVVASSCAGPILLRGPPAAPLS